MEPLCSIILCCDCPGIPQRAEAAAKIHSFRPPAMYIGKNAISGIAPTLPEEVRKYAQALTRNKEKFAYYFEYNIDGHVTFKYNLLTGKEVL